MHGRGGLWRLSSRPKHLNSTTANRARHLGACSCLSCLSFAFARPLLPLSALPCVASCLGINAIAYFVFRICLPPERATPSAAISPGDSAAGLVLEHLRRQAWAIVSFGGDTVAEEGRKGDSLPPLPLPSGVSAIQKRVRAASRTALPQPGDHRTDRTCRPPRCAECVEDFESADSR